MWICFLYLFNREGVGESSLAILHNYVVLFPVLLTLSCSKSGGLGKKSSYLAVYREVKQLGQYRITLLNMHVNNAKEIYVTQN